MNIDAEAALRQFKAIEANLTKLERLCQEIERLVPNEIVFGSDPNYENRCRLFREVLAALPMIDGWKPDGYFLSLNEIAKSRLDAQDLGEIEMRILVDESIENPGRELREYRFMFNKKQREFIQNVLSELILRIDSIIRNIKGLLVPNGKLDSSMEGPYWEDLRDHVAQIETLLGSNVKRLPKWNDLNRHLRFGLLRDFHCIEQNDWPGVKVDLPDCLFDINDPVPVKVKDLSELAASRPASLCQSLKDQKVMYSLGKKENETDWPLKIFISYSHKDEDFKDELVAMLAGLKNRGVIEPWQDRCIEDGDEWYQRIQDAIKNCDLALLLVSVNFIASRFIQDEELPKLLKRRMGEGLRVVPVIIRPCMWQSELILKDLQALPLDGKAVITYSKENGDRDQVWTDIAKTVEKHAKEKI